VSPATRDLLTGIYAPRPKSYAAVRDDIFDGDLLLWLPTTLAGRLICWGSRQPLSHSSMAGRGPDGRLRNVEMVQWRGGVTEPLADQIARYPGACQVWRPIDPKYNGRRALEAMLWVLGQPYGWLDLARIALRKVFPRISLPRAVNSNSPSVIRVCSACTTFALRIGGVIACPGKADVEVSPGDQAASGFARYRFTLFP
jgi:hypothetical protein